AFSRVDNSHELAKFDPDTGLQLDVGPSLVKSVSASMLHRFSFGMLQATFARASATEMTSNQPVPEAPRLIWDLSATALRLPYGLKGSFGFQYVGHKPLGDGLTAVPVQELHGSLRKLLAQQRVDLGVDFVWAKGYTGQTVETLRLPLESDAVERIVGVRAM